MVGLRGVSVIGPAFYLPPAFYQDVGFLEAGPEKWRASWQPSGALVGEGGYYLLPCLDAWDYFRVCVPWLWVLETSLGS